MLFKGSLATTSLIEPTPQQRDHGAWRLKQAL